MIRFLADENFDNTILQGVRLIYPELDVVRVQDTDIYQAEDPTVLDWAAREERILLTHDIRTMNRYAYDRVAVGLPMPGVFYIRSLLPVGQAIEALLLVLGASDASEWENKVTHLPLR
jgi:hypothetical protein